MLKAIAESGMGRNATIKGGVVMRSISKNARRATQDLDLDFIRYSISDDSIKRFIGKLNCLDGLKIGIAGNITELNHQDYKSKHYNGLGRYISRGYDTYGLFKLVGGLQKGNPTEEEIKRAVDFYKNLL